DDELLLRLLLLLPFVERLPELPEDDLLLLVLEELLLPSDDLPPELREDDLPFDEDELRLPFELRPLLSSLCEALPPFLAICLRFSGLIAPKPLRERRPGRSLLLPLLLRSSSSSS